MAKKLKGEKRGKFIMQVRKRVEKELDKEKKAEKKVKGKRLKAFLSAFSPTRIKASRRAIGRRAAGTSRFLKALTGDEQAGAGRPKGTFKYGMPIHEYNKLRSRKKALYDIYKQKQTAELQRRGLTPDQIQRLQYLKTLQEKGVVQIPQEIDVLETPQSVVEPVNEELRFRKFRADKTISPNTQKILRRLRYTQLKSERDDVDMQRRLKEKKMVAQAGNIMETPFIFNKHQIDLTGVEEENILNAPNYFKEREDNPNILKTKKLNIMQTMEAGNNLKFF